MSSPVKPPFGTGCATYPLLASSAISSIPLTTRLYLVESVSDPKRPLLHVEIKKGNARISDGTFVDQNVTDAWFCLDGECECPSGTEGTPPPAPSLMLPAVIGITGGTSEGAGSVTFVSLENFCKEKQKDPVPIVPIPQGTGGGRVGKTCTKSCGQSFAREPCRTPRGHARGAAGERRR